MRVAQYFVLVIFGAGGIFVAENIGLIGVGLFDWDYGLDTEISQTIRTFNRAVYGACATLPMMIIGRLFRISELPVVAAAIILGTVFYLLDHLRTGAPFFDLLVAFPNLIAPFIAGSFASIGAMSVFDKFWSFLRVARQSQPNGE